MSASCDDRLTSTETKVSGPSTGNEDPRKRPKAVQDMSECVGERLEHGEEENSPSRARVGLDHPRDSADASAASRSVEDVGKRPRKLREASKRVRKCSKPKENRNSPGRP